MFSAIIVTLPMSCLPKCVFKHKHEDGIGGKRIWRDADIKGATRATTQDSCIEKTEERREY